MASRLPLLHAMATWAELIIPPRRLTGAETAWILFVVVQALDGVFSYVGVRTIGSGIEANPLLAWYLSVIGPGAVFLGAKLFAVGCGAILYVTGRHGWIAGLTATYVVFAVGPWVHVLALTHI
jgi:hypothetical protein